MSVSVSDEKSTLEKDLQRLAHALMQLDAVKVQHSEAEVLDWLLQYAEESREDATGKLPSVAESSKALEADKSHSSKDSVMRASGLSVDVVSTATDPLVSSPALVQGLMQLALEQLKEREFMASIEHRPQSLACDVWRFQNKKEKWVAFVGLLEGRPYEIFTGLQDDEEGIVLPKSVNTGWIVKNLNFDGTSRYDFSFQNRRGYKTTVEGLSARFNKEYWNYAKLISGVLRHGMPVENVISLIDSLQLESDAINTWKAGVVRALKKYTNNCGDSDEPLTQD